MTSAADDILRDLAEARALPDAALAMALIHIDDLAPRFIAAVEQAAAGTAQDEEEANLFFYGVHVLAAARRKGAFEPFLRALRRSEEEVDHLLGDALTETFPRLVAGLYEDRPSDLFAALADRDLDGVIRWGIFGALTFLTWEGRIDRNETVRFLERFDDERLAEPEDLAWVGWHDAIGMLGLEELAERVAAAWREGRMPPGLFEPELLSEQLAAARAAPDDRKRFTMENLGYLDDLVADLEWMASDSDEDGEDFGESPEPARNPFRHVGRNDPCPCGSGKKAKNCCLRDPEAR